MLGMLRICIGKRKKKVNPTHKTKDINDNMYYCTSCKKEFDCLYTHIYSDEHIDDSCKEDSKNFNN